MKKEVNFKKCDLATRVSNRLRLYTQDFFLKGPIRSGCPQVVGQRWAARLQPVGRAVMGRQTLDAYEEAGRELRAQPKAMGLPAAEPTNPPDLLPTAHWPSPSAPLPPSQAA